MKSPESLLVPCSGCGESLTIADEKGISAVRAGRKVACRECSRTSKVARETPKAWNSIDESTPPGPRPGLRSKKVQVLVGVVVLVALGLGSWGLMARDRLEPAPDLLPAVENVAPQPKKMTHVSETTSPKERPISRVTPEPTTAVSKDPAAEAVPVSKEAPAPDPALQAHLERWKSAMGHATLRRYSKAMEELTKSVGTETSPECRRQRASDLEDLNRLTSWATDFSKELARLPRGASVALDLREQDGSIRKIAGRVLRSDRERVELLPPESKESVFAEWRDATAASLVALMRARASHLDEWVLAMFVLLDGDEGVARASLGNRSDLVPEKYWAYAKDARSRLPASEPADTGRATRARELFYAAEREYRSARLRGSAAEKYRILREELSDTDLVKSNESRIGFRAEPCREYALTAVELRGVGTFELTASRSPAAWVSSSDLEFSRGHENFIEIEFFAFADLPYRCWVQVGGCCAETFTCFYQVSDLTGPHPQKKGAGVALEPGSIYALPVNVSAIPVKPSHLSHATRNQPKTPSTWAWVEIPLAKWTTPGIKRVRILSVQQGFAVARAMISATRTAAPSAEELKDLDESGVAMPVEEKTDRMKEVDPKKPPPRKGKPRDE